MLLLRVSTRRDLARRPLARGTAATSQSMRRGIAARSLGAGSTGFPPPTLSTSRSHRSSLRASVVRPGSRATCSTAAWYSPGAAAQQFC